MTLSRIDLDDVASPAAIAARIHELAGDLGPAFDLEALCRQLDIVEITEIVTSAFEAALITDANKAAGSILLAAHRQPERRRFSIGHELGHFLIPSHRPLAGDPLHCSVDDLHLVDTREKDRRKRIEAEANRFAATLLMPPRRVRAAMVSREPDFREIVQLSKTFAMSKEAMARTYVDASRQTIAVIILQHGKIRRVYRGDRDFPRIAPWIGQAAPEGSIACSNHLQPGDFSESEECELDIWLDPGAAAGVEVLTEQVLGQAKGFAMVLLHAELVEN